MVKTNPPTRPRLKTQKGFINGLKMKAQAVVIKNWKQWASAPVRSIIRYAMQVGVVNGTEGEPFPVVFPQRHPYPMEGELVDFCPSNNFKPSGSERSLRT